MKFSRRSSSALSSYDSILDTMTNVVAVLIVVVAVTQLNVGDAVRGIRVQLPDVAPEALTQARAEEAKVRSLLATLRQRWETLEARVPDQRIELTDLRRSIATLAGQAASPTEFSARRDVLIAEIARLEQRESELRTEENDVLGKVRDLRAALDATPAPVLAQRPVVRLPNPDASRAEGKKVYRFICRRGQVFPVDEEGLDPTLFAEMSRVAGDLKQTSIVRKLDEVKQHFVTNDFGNEFFRLKVIGQKRTVGNVIRFSLGAAYELRESAPGTGLERIGDPATGFQVQLARLDPRARWIEFNVWDDSFETYIAARVVAEQAGFAVGWDPMAGQDFSWSLIGGSGGGGVANIPD